MEETKSFLTLDKLNEISDGNISFKNKMLKIFLQEGKKQIKVFTASPYNQDRVSKTAHQMKPSLDYLANKNLCALVRKVERKEFLDDQEVLMQFNMGLETLLEEVEFYLKNETK